MTEKYRSLYDLEFEGEKSSKNDIPMREYSQSEREEQTASMVRKDRDVSQKTKNNKKKANWLTFLLWFIFIAVIAFLILYAWKPEILQQTDSRNNPTGEVDGVKVLVASLIVSSVVTFIIFIIYVCLL